ncbi:MAG: lysophospholipid acyltransferase family protein [Alphaproteobacteria bacterium]
MKNLIEYFFLKFFYFLFKLIGLRISSFLGGMIFYFYGLFSKRNLIVFRNLKRAFPDMEIEESNKLKNKMWFHFGRVVGEYPHLNKIKLLNNKNIKIENKNNLLEPLNKYQNCLFFSAHIGNWELTSHLLTQNGHEISFIYRAPNNQLVDNLLRKIRQSYGVNLIRKGSEGAKDCLKVLKTKGGHIGMLIDQKMNDGIETFFFNEKVMSPSAIAKLSLKYKCPIIPAVCIRTHSINFKISYLNPITPEEIQKIGNETRIVNKLNNYIECWVKNHPEQWIWFHNRWND